MSFHIYEHWTAEKKAVIHDSKCSRCNNGQGCHPNHPRGNKNGRWIGPFETLEKAKKVAKSTGKSYRSHDCVKE